MYMAPEIIITHAAYGPKADIWALGCACFEMMTLQQPFAAVTLPELCRLVQLMQFRCELPDTYTSPLRRAVMEMLSARAELRPGAAELRMLPCLRPALVKFNPATHQTPAASAPVPAIDNDIPDPPKQLMRRKSMHGGGEPHVLPPLDPVRLRRASTTSLAAPTPVAFSLAVQAARHELGDGSGIASASTESHHSSPDMRPRYPSDGGVGPVLNDRSAVPVHRASVPGYAELWTQRQAFERQGRRSRTGADLPPLREDRSSY